MNHEDWCKKEMQDCCWQGSEPDLTVVCRACRRAFEAAVKITVEIIEKNYGESIITP
jgi:hypothetical protein